ncbi:helix-turn-helix domain-containing protein [Nonomuraea sp. NPDC052116]|uniref:helix-turn-helix domain-containing protein n=1 Tax=Nonomuraea sp. NPDC052116 TaxID=3155665 RepID=UPI003448C3E3
MSDAPVLAAAPSKALILASVPRSMRRTPDQQAFLRALREDPEVIGLRYDGYGNLLRVAQVIAWAADWKTMCSRPTIAGICARTGLSKATVKRWVRWLREHGWLGVVEEGSTVRFRKGTAAGLDDDGMGNRAALWVICIPRDITPIPTSDTSSDQVKDLSEPPSFSLPEREGTDPTRTREAPRQARRSPRISPAWALHESPRTKRDRLAACERLRQESNVLRHMTPWYLRWLLRPFLVAGWTPADVLYALDVRADGIMWTYTWLSVDELRHIPGWVHHRLSAWVEADGQVLPSRSLRLAAAAEKQRAEQEERRRARLAAAAVAGVELVEEPRMSRTEALAPFVPARERSNPNEAFRAARAELERHRQERKAEIAAALARRRR